LPRAGIDELAAQIEEPFSILPLTPLVEVIKRETDELFDIAPALMAATDPTLSEDTWQARWG
jgi:predicted membrane chloride channel (bestrophin family)